ncbi:hypothetical protein D3C71_1977540 [compost metagenome]
MQGAQFLQPLPIGARVRHLHRCLLVVLHHRLMLHRRDVLAFGLGMCDLLDALAGLLCFLGCHLSIPCFPAQPLQSFG